jgi:hypothetical protein
MEQARRSALAHHVNRFAPVGARVLINETWYKVAPGLPPGGQLEPVCLPNTPFRVPGATSTMPAKSCAEGHFPCTAASRVGPHDGFADRGRSEASSVIQAPKWSRRWLLGQNQSPEKAAAFKQRVQCSERRAGGGTLHGRLRITAQTRNRLEQTHIRPKVTQQLLGQELNEKQVGRGFLGLPDDAPPAAFAERLARPRVMYSTEDALTVIGNGIKRCLIKKNHPKYADHDLLIEAPLRSLPRERWSHIEDILRSAASAMPFRQIHVIGNQDTEPFGFRIK